ncbi:hypothetical protein EAS61_41560 [Bradyrhizobium zhanjiangense]|uniref:Tryptophan-rich domain-containing protein n=1 Tax=Bradyrhizobium zhanjiangense TaxID=1325107 RepID=A0A4Q0Q3P1_9BRAD|nr:hypothetical protein EAS61_41560 [Bradyrhizobium zhanjiangense]
MDQIGSYYFLDPVSGGTGPSVKYAGTPFAASTQVGGWTPIGAEQTANGYQIAWKVIGSDQYSVWNADSNGNYVSSATAVVSGSSAILEAFESSFHQDLNADGVIGIPTTSVTVVEAAGLTKLDQIGSYYFLDPISGGTGPSVKYAGTPFAASTQVGAWTPIGAEQTANGYQIAWKVIGSDQYSVWNAESNGNYVSSATAVVSGSSAILEPFESSFQQDLNADSVIGIPAASVTVVEAAGSSPASQGARIAAGNDSFVLHRGIDGAGVVNAGSAEVVAPDGFSLVAICKQLTELLHETPSDQSHAISQLGSDFHDAVMGRDTANVHMADLNTGYFIVH